MYTDPRSAGQMKQVLQGMCKTMETQKLHSMYGVYVPSLHFPSLSFPSFFLPTPSFSPLPLPSFPSLLPFPSHSSLLPSLFSSPPSLLSPFPDALAQEARVRIAQQHHHQQGGGAGTSGMHPSSHGGQGQYYQQVLGIYIYSDYLPWLFGWFTHRNTLNTSQWTKVLIKFY